MSNDDIKKSTLGTSSGSHKYIKRTGVPGNFRYWYQLPNGHIVTSDDETGPPHTNHDITFNDKAEDEKTGSFDLEGNLKDIKAKQDAAQKELEEKQTKEWMNKFNTSPITFLIQRDDRHNEKTIKNISKRILGGPTKDKDADPLAHGFSIGAAPVLNLTFGDLKSLEKEFSNKLFKKFDTDISNLATNYDSTIIRNLNSAGSWMDTDIDSMVLEPSKRVELLSSDNRLVKAMAAQLGKEYKQQAVYVAEYSDKGKGIEYAIKFDDIKNAEEIINKQNDYGFQGSALDTVNKTIYFGDPDSKLSSNFKKSRD